MLEDLLSDSNCGNSQLLMAINRSNWKVVIHNEKHVSPFFFSFYLSPKARRGEQELNVCSGVMTSRPDVMQLFSFFICNSEKQDLTRSVREEKQSLLCGLSARLR